MIIGLTGKNCAGKGTTAEYLTRKGFYYLSLSDIIREELVAENGMLTRENLIEKGNDLRKKFGPGVLATKIKAKMEKDRNYVVDSIRNPFEVKELQELENFFLIHITAEPEVRFERMKERGRESDPKTYDAFLHIEKLEEKNADNTKQNLQETSKMAVKILENNGTKKELYERVDYLLGELNEQYRPDRPTWDNYFMNIAKEVASRSNCIKRKVAAVIVKDKRIISTGYNGTPRGTKNCNEGGCPRCNAFTESGKNLDECFCSHGEENAIVQAAYHGVSVKGGTIYTTFSPCLYCTRMIINSGIEEVVYNSKYPMGDSPFKLLKEAGIKVRSLEVD
ncbi:AAA family ATPase [Candidatus Micrarchaeota archaeon]|nr:AAA family ATPase [Candidatus Micrarchaeota archaeon]